MSAPSMRWIRRVVAILAVTFGLTMLTTMSAQAALSTSSARTWSTSGTVHVTLALGSGKVLVAGLFGSVIDPSGRRYPAGNVALFDTASGAFDTSWSVRTDGDVKAAATDGATVYLGGPFTTVNGASRKGLVAIDRASGAVRSGFSPTVGSGEVRALAVAGGSVYAGGTFLRVNDDAGQSSGAYLARLRADTGGVIAWSPAPDGPVYATTVDNAGTGLYVGGDFSTVAGQTGARVLVRFRLSDGGYDSAFRSGPNNGSARSPVSSIVQVGNLIAVSARGGGGGCAVQDAATGATRWTKHANGDVEAVAVLGSTVYCGGHFGGTGGFDGQVRKGLAAVDLSTGTTLGYNPRLDSALPVFALAASGGRLFVGGDFSRYGSTTDQTRFAMVLDTADVTVPAAPGNLVATGLDRRVDLAWDVPSTDGGSSILKYRVYRTSGGVTTRLPDVTGNRSADTGLVNGVSYSYRVEAVNGVGTSPSSATVGATTGAVGVLAPSAPVAAAVEAGPKSMALTWVEPYSTGGAAISGYRVYRSAGGAFSVVANLGSGARSYTDTAVTSGMTYSYRVTALNAAGESAPSATVSGTPSTGKPGAPVLSGSSTGGAVQLSWTTPSDGGSAITKYVLVRDNVRLATLPATQRSYTDSAVRLGVSYKYQIRAINAAGSGPMSNSVTVRVR